MPFANTPTREFKRVGASRERLTEKLVNVSYSVVICFSKQAHPSTCPTPGIRSLVFRTDLDLVGINSISLVILIIKSNEEDFAFAFAQGTSNVAQFRAVRIVEFPTTPAAFDACPGWLEWEDDASTDFVLSFIDEFGGHAVEDFAKTSSAIAVGAAFFHGINVEVETDKLFLTILEGNGPRSLHGQDAL